MEKVVLDAFALLTMLGKDTGYEAVETHLEKSADGQLKAYMSLINWGEVYYILLKRGKTLEAEELWEGRRSYPIDFVEPTARRIREAGKIKATYPVSYADAFCIALAIEREAEVITGDEEFKTVDGLKLIWIR